MAFYKKGFQGNERIRASGIEIEWDVHKVSEFKRCADDPTYFIRNYIKILNLDSEELVLFNPRQYQLNMIETIRDSRYTIAKWSRQSGKTTTAAAMLLWYVIFNSNYPVLILAHKHDKAREILAVVQKMYEFLPEWLQHGVTSWAKGSIELENGSSIKTAGTSSSSGRGGTYALLILDEFAFVPSHLADEFLKSVVPTISSGKNTKLVITSTPKGLNTFYRLWQDSIKGKNDYKRVDINWWDVPGRDERWKEGIISSYGLDYFRQEFESQFLGSSRTLISGDKLTSISTDVPIHEAEHVRVYAYPERGRNYALTVDVSEGLGSDYSAAVVFDITSLPYRPVCVYRNNLIDPMALPAVVCDMGKRYNDALVLVEANFGQQVGEILYTDYEYENMVFTTKGKNGPQAKVDRITGGFSGRSRVGLAWSKNSKRVGCSNLKTLVEQDQLMIVDQWAYDELTRFAVKKDSYAAEDGNDDVAMCFVLFAWMADQGYVRDSTSVDIRSKLAEIKREALDRDVPISFFSDGTETEVEAIHFSGDQTWRRPAIEVPDPDDPQSHPWEGLFDKKRARGGLSEAQLHDKFMREILGGYQDS